jgi:4-amino-4-deoxy-L-arabinose transferase-like glycosyltransferase
LGIQKVKKYIVYLVLGLIVILALFLRVYRLDEIPPSLSWDEASFSYNAYTIANWGKDEWGRVLPLSFESFGEYKNPVDIYVSAPFIKIFGLNEFATRAPAALFGVLNVILIYFLAKALFRNELLALSASFFLAISPYNLQFSRHHHELNITLFFFMLGLILFYKAIRQKGRWFAVAVISFCLSILTYNAAKFVVPLSGIFLAIIYRKDLLRIKKEVLLGAIPLVILGIIFLANRNLLGLARFKQTSVNDEQIYNTAIYKKTRSRLLGRVEIIIRQYPLHFSYKYLFVSGDGNPRHSIQTVGEFYKSDLPFLFVGFGYLFYLITKKKSRESAYLLFWLIIAPLPSAMQSEAPHAARSMFMLGSWQILAAVGLAYLTGLFKSKLIKVLIIALFILLTGLYFVGYIRSYYQSYSSKYATEWQYGMKQIVEYVNEQKSVNAVYVTEKRSQPYIFFLYYLKTPLPQYLSTVKPNNGPSSGVNRISSFGKYHFGDWDTTESYPEIGVYYVLTGTEYTGLFYKHRFEVRKLIKYPDGTDAFYIVTAR